MPTGIPHGGVIDKYRLVESIGEGGMGVVYHAVHQRLDRRCALKMMRSGMSEANRKRFDREIDALSSLSHENIVPITDAGEIDGVPYLVMEFVEGENVSSLSSRCGPLPIPVACEIVRQMALGLHYAHQHGIIHRDVKPGNVMLDRRGVVRLLDLGLARISAHGAEALTETGELFGTPDYIAPEQCTGRGEISAATDVYSLGCTFYCLLTGKPPFAGENVSTFEKIQRHLLEVPPMASSTRSDIPAELDKLLLEMLAKSPANRVSSAAEVTRRITPFSQLDALVGLAQPKHNRTGDTDRIDAAIQETDEHVHVNFERRSSASSTRIGVVLLAILLVALVVALSIAQLPGCPTNRKANENRAIPLEEHDRHIAEWVIGLGGEVGITHGDRQYIMVRNVEKLPKAFQVQHINLSDASQSVTDEVIESLDGFQLPRLESVILDGTQVTNQCLETLRQFPLIDLSLEYTRIDDRGAELIGSMRLLEVLELCGTQITDEGLRHLEKLERIRRLDVSDLVDVTDEGLERLGNAHPDAEYETE